MAVSRLRTYKSLKHRSIEAGPDALSVDMPCADLVQVV